MIATLEAMRNVRCSKCCRPMVTSLPKGAKVLFTCDRCREIDEAVIRRPRESPPPYRQEPEKMIPAPSRIVRPHWLPALMARIEVHLIAGRWELALRVLEEERSENRSVDPDSISVHQLGLTWRITTALEANGIETVAQFLRYDKVQLLAMKGIAQASITAITAAIQRLGVRTRRR